MLIQATQLRPGMIVEYNRELYRIMTITHITPGNWRGMVQTKLRNVKTGSQTENRFRSEDRVERVILNQSKMQFLYQDGDSFVFMDQENYEQLSLSAEFLEGQAGYLLPNTDVQINFYNGRAIGVELPPSVVLTVEDTEPGIKNSTATNSFKPARMETGITVQVPPFINKGEKIKIDTAEGTYMERA